MPSAHCRSFVFSVSLFFTPSYHRALFRLIRVYVPAILVAKIASVASSPLSSLVIDSAQISGLHRFTTVVWIEIMKIICRGETSCSSFLAHTWRSRSASFWCRLLTIAPSLYTSSGYSLKLDVARSCSSFCILLYFTLPIPRCRRMDNRQHSDALGAIVMHTFHHWQGKPWLHVPFRGFPMGTTNFSNA